MQSALFKNNTFLHIPKTAGTALLSLASKDIEFFNISHSHHTTIFTSDSNVIFCIRDPWERFCSGFWEIKTLDLRHNLFIKSNPTLAEQYNEEHTRFQKSQPVWYKDLLIRCNTPNDFCSFLKEDTNVKTKLYSFGNDSNFKNHNPLGLATQSITWWLGELSQYAQIESRVTAAIEIRSLDYFMKTVFNIEMPTDPFIMRSRAQFNLDQSYDITNDNLKWFTGMFRKQDYELIEYIKQQPYYFEKALTNV